MTKQENDLKTTSAQSRCTGNTILHWPAKSTRFMTELFFVSPLSVLMIWSKIMVTTVWARLLVAFMLVEATVRDCVPEIYTHPKNCRPVSPSWKCLRYIKTFLVFKRTMYWYEEQIDLKESRTAKILNGLGYKNSLKIFPQRRQLWYCLKTCDK